MVIYAMVRGFYAEVERAADPRLRARPAFRRASEIDALRITLSESHVARGWYEAPLA